MSESPKVTPQKAFDMLRESGALEDDVMMPMIEAFERMAEAEFSHAAQAIYGVILKGRDDATVEQAIDAQKTGSWLLQLVEVMEEQGA